MAKDNNSSRKESFRLWWEYLKRSKEYKKLVDAFNEAKIIEGGYARIFGAKEFPDSLVEVYYHFEDIYETRFDEWWEKKKLLYFGDRVWDYSEIIGKEIDSLYSAARECKEPEPSAKDFKIDFFSRLEDCDQDSLYLKLSLTRNGSIDDFMKKIREMVKRKKKEIDFELCPTQPIRLKELERYLRVYDLRDSGKKWREVAEIIYPKGSRSKGLERSLYIDLAKARKIIKNAAKGVFPGKY